MRPTLSAVLIAASLAVASGALPAAGAFEVPPVAGSSYSPVVHDGAPIPQPFAADALVGYVSDVSSYSHGVYVDVIAGYTNLAQQHPEVLASNLDQAVAINNAAGNDPALIARAQQDARADTDGLLPELSSAFGPLAPHFEAALAEGRLPKTQLLFGGGWAARAGGLASATWVEKEIYGVQRPHVVAPDRIVRYPVADRDIYLTSKSFPSGHTNQATWMTTLLAAALPKVGPELLARGSDAGYHRVVLGVHYPLDVIGGRMTGTAAAADRWNDPKMRANVEAAAQEIRMELEWRCGASISDCLGETSSADAVGLYTQRMNYEFAPVYSTNAPMIVPQAAPDLLLHAHPGLSYAQRAEILRQTAGPAGMPLDDQSPSGSWQRINLARAMASQVQVLPDGRVVVSG